MMGLAEIRAANKTRAKDVRRTDELLDFVRNVAGLDNNYLSDLDILRQWRDDARALLAKFGGKQ